MASAMICRISDWPIAFAGSNLLVEIRSWITASASFMCFSGSWTELLSYWRSVRGEGEKRAKSLSSSHLVYHKRFSSGSKETSVNRKCFIVLYVFFFSLLACAQTPAPSSEKPSTLVDRVADTGFVQLRAESFRA